MRFSGRIVRKGGAARAKTGVEGARHGLDRVRDVAHIEVGLCAPSGKARRLRSATKVLDHCV